MLVAAFGGGGGSGSGGSSSGGGNSSHNGSGDYVGVGGGPVYCLCVTFDFRSPPSPLIFSARFQAGLHFIH